MIRNTLIAGACCVALAGCEGIQQHPNTAGGAAIGALVGAAAGTLVGGNDRRNALVGAGIGLLAGAAIGSYLDQQQRELNADLAGTGAEVSRDGDALLVTMPAGITFDVDSARIKPQFYGPLDRMAATLRKYPQSYIDVIGHTDSTGDPGYNQQLSERRAGAVQNRLVSRGVNRARMAAYGQGERQPVATNATTAGRAANRRVEVRIVPAT